MKIVLSHRAFFPGGAFFSSSDKLANDAQKLGYQGVEFLPTWRFVYEMLVLNKLTCDPSLIASGHRDWRFDRIMQASLAIKPWWRYQLSEKADYLFPPSSVCCEALKKFQTQYKVPISVMWFEDTKNFRSPMLEIWGTKQGIDQIKLLKWVKEDKKHRGIVLDTAKIDNWLSTNNLVDREDKVINDLLPYIWEVHYRGAKKGNKRNLAQIARSRELLKKIIKMGYDGQVVVEFGWPDLDKPATPALHKSILKEIKSLL